MPSIKVDADGVPYWEQPIATKWDYSVDWRTRLNGTSDTVTSSNFSAITSGLAISSAAHTVSGLHTVWVSPSAGNAGNSYYLVSKIFTAAGRTERACIKVTVQQECGS